ncbi:sulfite exporter TauE/SafE family protein [Corynebacterium ammoniagenes]|jgi:hypothetical protein|uniref:sulfite exporter TauE/SafE family protein n=1 Tax=Corynebacterium ammoniagenes TaxID=1697 RepID=UPI001459CF3A|nr:sulfite exporter TauE/SafE family protein [Corynebacterium ammoniagenes]NMF31602.1 sulfite exporter TauE/SafE family protein [Corynebacterium ammoniagenes]
MIIALGVFLAIAVGSCMQRVSGMGVGLITGPVISILLGPVEGIMVLNILACANAAATTVTVRRNVQWRYVWLIGSVLVIGSVPAAFLIAATETAPLLIIVGALLLIALAVVTFGKNLFPSVTGRTPALTAGVLGGFANTLAGVAGPVFTVYFTAAKWPQAQYAATMQPLFMIAGALSFIVKALVGAASLTSIDWLVWPAGIAGMLVGISIGGLIAGKIDKAAARKLSLFIAAAGATAAIIRGVTSL